MFRRTGNSANIAYYRDGNLWVQSMHVLPLERDPDSPRRGLRRKKENGRLVIPYFRITVHRNAVHRDVRGPDIVAEFEYHPPRDLGPELKERQITRLVQEAMS